MKTTFKTSELPHIWFHSRAPHGKASANVSFNSDGYFSYDTVIARKVENKAGDLAVIINHNQFSVSTSKHKSDVRHAIPSFVKCFVYAEGMGARLRVEPLALFEFQIEQATRAQAESDTTRPSGKKDRLALEASDWLAQAQAVSDFFGLKIKVDSKTSEKLEAKKRKIAKAEQKRQLEKYTEAFEGWKKGFNQYFPASLFPVAFRVDGEKLESSKGVRLDLAQAKRVLPLVLRCKGESKTVNLAIDGYLIQSVNAKGIIAGCHEVTWGELERVSAMLA